MQDYDLDSYAEKIMGVLNRAREEERFEVDGRKILAIKTNERRRVEGEWCPVYDCYDEKALICAECQADDPWA